MGMAKSPLSDGANLSLGLSLQNIMSNDINDNDMK
jgi:hypothetical protein